MQKQTLVFEGMQVESDYTAVNYTCNFTVTTAGDGLWGCEEGRQVNVTAINVITNAIDDYVSVMVNVEHNSTWDIYTDTGFETAISEAIGFTVRFTEQGMQEDEFASMEAA